MNDEVICYECHKPINFRNELITLPYLIAARPFHSSCAAIKLKSGKGFFMQGFNLSGVGGTLVAIFLPVLGIWWLYHDWFFELNYRRFDLGDVLVLIVILTIFFIMIFEPIYLKLYSYFKFEKKLKGN